MTVDPVDVTERSEGTPGQRPGIRFVEAGADRVVAISGSLHGRMVGRTTRRAIP
jgi:hypothetical protein